MKTALQNVTESKGIVSLIMNSLDSRLTLDDEDSRTGLGLVLEAVITRLSDAESALVEIEQPASEPA
jgi:hypothetical protein